MLQETKTTTKLVLLGLAIAGVCSMVVSRQINNQNREGHNQYQFTDAYACQGSYRCK